MSTNLRCTTTLHTALLSDPAAFARLPLLGYQLTGDDVLEQRCCPTCGDTLSRELGIGALLAAARTGGGDQSMIGICKRALSPDPMTDRIDEGAIAAFKSAVQLEALMAMPVRGARREVRS